MMSYDPLSSLIGPFFGVLTAFIINYMYQAWRNRRKRSKYLEIFRDEINNSIKLLREGKGKLLPYDRWTAAVNSGDLNVFPSNAINKLSQAYFTIRNYNYEAKRARDMGERFRSEAAPKKKEQICLAWREASKVVEEYRREALHKLQELSNEEWFKDP